MGLRVGPGLLAALTFWPAVICEPVMLFARRNAATVVPLARAIRVRLSPDFTRYVAGAVVLVAANLRVTAPDLSSFA